MTLNTGDRIVYTYTHYLNSTATTQVSRHGVFLEMKGFKKNKRYVSGTHCKVQLDRNKNPSVVPVYKLKQEAK